MQKFLNIRQFFVITCFYINMDSVNNNSSIPYQAADVGILTPPDHIEKYKITDFELENKFKQLNKDVFSRQKHVDFEDKKKTPKGVKFILGGGILIFLWQVLKRTIKI